MTVNGDGFELGGRTLPMVRFGASEARVVSARASRISVVVPDGLPTGPTRVTVAGADGEALVQTGSVVADGLHQVDNPAFDAQGRLHVTYSGSRGQPVPVSIFRIGRDGSM